jgi:hypothetical protein
VKKDVVKKDVVLRGAITLTCVGSASLEKSRTVVNTRSFETNRSATITPAVQGSAIEDSHSARFVVPSMSALAGRG